MIGTAGGHTENTGTNQDTSSKEVERIRALVIGGQLCRAE